MYKLWFVVNVHSTSCTAVCHLGYIVLELTTACLFFYHFACAMGYCDWSSDKGLCSEFVHVGCGVIK